MPPVADVAVCICTYRRNEPLGVVVRGAERALRALTAATGKTGLIVISDDNPNGEAEPMVEQLRAETGRRIEYRRAGRQNISYARNTALEAGFALASFVALLDDDGEPFDDWLVESFKMRESFDADIVTGPIERKFPDPCPAWLTKHEFLGLTFYEDGCVPPFGCTANALLRSEWFVDNSVRFELRLGVTGGEDMVFFNAAAEKGAHHRYARQASVWEILPPERATFRYQFYDAIWFGNSEALTNLENQRASRLRLVARAGRRVQRDTVAIMKRVVKREPIGGRYWLSQIGGSAGMVAGALGARLPHK
jgi:succinoglycan biosynthesis protein ExoM